MRVAFWAGVAGASLLIGFLMCLLGVALFGGARIVDGTAAGGASGLRTGVVDRGLPFTAVSETYEVDTATDACRMLSRETLLGGALANVALWGAAAAAGFIFLDWVQRKYGVKL